VKEHVRRQINDDILMVVAANRPTSSSAAAAAANQGFNLTFLIYFPTKIHERNNAQKMVLYIFKYLIYSLSLIYPFL
jgi:hypothetical protein